MSIKIALAGNPNSGKTTLFNALTGANQYVGNWPGVTVEKKEGKLKNNKDVSLVDLPGIYSLSPYTQEEVVARNFLIDERPDAILNIVDGTNIERNLYLTTQLLELGIPVVIAVNMMDVVKKRGDKISVEALSKKLGCRAVEISALKTTGIEEVQEAMIAAANEDSFIPKHSFSGPVEHALAHIEEAVIHDMPEEIQRWYSIKIFERDKDIIKKLKIDKDVLDHIEKDIVAVEKEFDDDAESIITNERYEYITGMIGDCYKKKRKERFSTSDKIDKVVTNKFLALPIFAVIMFVVYYLSISTVGTMGTDWVNDVLFGEIIPNALDKWLNAIHCAPWLHSLVVDGIVGGVGAVLGFLPQIMVLFILLAILEGCGYMARVAFIMDKIFRKFGLSGKSFIPILIGTGCGVPGIMASRTIENDRDRKITIMTTTFIPCSAKIPIIALISSSLFGGAWWVAPSAYFLGIAAIVVSGIILKKTKLFEGDPSPFVMELPEYHMPTVGAVLRSMWERSWSFIKKAGTIILLSSIIIWFASKFGWVNGHFVFDEELNLAKSILGHIGSGVKIIFAPLGFGTGKAGTGATVATVMGLVAKEEVVGVFGTLHESVKEFGVIAGYSFLIFNLLCAPCFAAMGAIKREMNSWKWFGIAIGYQCLFAYVIALIVYQFGILFAGRANVIGLVVASICTVGLAYLLFRKNKYIKQ
ncbi:MAG: ferrous iron transport protein B [Eubacterium sp.]|nr:ferrous iron transport protein B [Eubacterium sp.]